MQIRLANDLSTVLYNNTFWWVDMEKKRLLSEHDFLQDDSETVDVSFLSSVDRSSCHTQQLGGCPQLITVKLILAHLHIVKRLVCSVIQSSKNS